MVPAVWLPHADTSLVAPGWSISTEFQFYAIAPLLCCMLNADRTRCRLAIGLVILVAGLWPNFIDSRLIAPANVLRYLGVFVPGMIGFRARNGR